MDNEKDIEILKERIKELRHTKELTMDCIEFKVNE